MFEIDPKKFKAENFTRKDWGHKFSLGSNPHYRIDLLEIRKSGYCSWHFHHREYNKFVVLEGTLALYINHSNGDTRPHIIGPKEDIVYYTVRPGDKHLFFARTNVQVIEIVYACVTKHDIVRTFPGGFGGVEEDLKDYIR